MREKLFQYLTFIFCCNILNVNAAYYETLPKGVRMFVLREVLVNNINSQFGKNGQIEDFYIKQKLDAKSLENAHEALNAGFQALKEISPEAYENFSFGEYEASWQANVHVRGTALGVGVTERLTVYGIIPYYMADSEIYVSRLATNNYEQTFNLLKRSDNDSYMASVIRSLTTQLEDADPALIQSLLTSPDVLGYQPLGRWEAQGLGDIEVGFLYRLTDWKDSGMAISSGVVFPTGRQDNPDILQDIPFGDGQYDLYLEFGGGINTPTKLIELDSSIRYTYQFKSTKTLRIPESADFPLSANKGEFEEKLGDKIEYKLTPALNFTEWLNIYSSYIYQKQFRSEYDSIYTQANEYLAQNSQNSAHFIKAGTNISSVKLFLAQKFLIPMSFGVSATKMLKGTNTPKYTRFDFDISLFF